MVTLGMGMIGGKGSMRGGQSSILMIIRSRVKHSGLAAGWGWTVLVGWEPCSLCTTVVETRISCVVKGGGSVEVVVPSVEAVIRGGSQVVVLVMGG
jgi:hypothetical protein